MNKNNGITTGQSFGNFMDELLNRSISDIVGTDSTYDTPAVNIVETDEAFEVEIAAPGMAKDAFKIEIEKDHLTVSADRTSEEKEESEDQSYKRREYNYQKFTRRFRLPNTVDKATVKAKYLQGILKVTLEKTPEAKEKGPRTVEIS